MKNLTENKKFYIMKRKGGREMEKREDVIPFETICNNHLHTIWMLKQFKKTGDIWYIDQSIKLIRYCKKQGQKLENRCRTYLDGILEMGFQRVYKSKKGSKLKSWQKSK